MTWPSWDFFEPVVKTTTRLKKFHLSHILGATRRGQRPQSW
jgi:hypothetical protein